MTGAQATVCIAQLLDIVGEQATMITGLQGFARATMGEAPDKAPQEPDGAKGHNP